VTAEKPLPLVSVVTPTWRRRELLMKRCVASVQDQAYPNIEHVIVSDGPDPRLREEFNRLAPRNLRLIWFLELAEHDPGVHWGHLARRYALSIADGELITYCDDDDSLRPYHVTLLAKALAENPDAGFAVSRMMCHGPGGDSVTGWGPLEMGNVGSPMIMHRRSALEHGTWGPASFTEDWDMVQRWMKAGITCADVPVVTSDVLPSIDRGA
jgi:glycosyltransferase involved in cell wall biosynthesis